MNYDLQLLPEAIEDLAYWKRSGQKKVLKKIVALLEELKVHPQTGTGKPEALKGDFAGLWSRRIDKGADSSIPSTKRSFVSTCSPCEGIMATNNALTSRPARESSKKTEEARQCATTSPTRTQRSAAAHSRKITHPKIFSPRVKPLFPRTHTKRPAAPQRRSAIPPQHLITSNSAPL